MKTLESFLNEGQINALLPEQAFVIKGGSSKRGKSKNKSKKKSKKSGRNGGGGYRGGYGCGW